MFNKVSGFYADDANKQMIPGYKKVNFTFSKNLESSKYNFLIKLNIDNFQPISFMII